MGGKLTTGSPGGIILYPTILLLLLLFRPLGRGDMEAGDRNREEDDTGGGGGGGAGA